VLWSREVETSIGMNLTQLTGHPDYIPLLVAQEAAGDVGGEQSENRGLSIQLLDKKTGDLLERHSIASEFRGISNLNSGYLLVTPTRMLVQLAGRLVAYGDSTLKTGP
jgi:hypothetical protein